MVTRCSKCIMVVTRPDLYLTDGVCSACIEHEKEKLVDWDARLAALIAYLDVGNARPYHAVVPVSGGKDSTYQVVKLQELGARVLAVNSATDYLTPLGRRNLDNLRNLCDVVEIAPRREVRNKLVRMGLFLVGDPSWPEHVAIWSNPTRIAVERSIPLVVYGECPQRDIAPPAGGASPTTLDAAWVAEFGGLLGLRLEDAIGYEDLTAQDLELFHFSSNMGMTKGIWLGDYIPWDGARNAFIAQQYGFEVSSTPVEYAAANYENLDNYLTVLRDYLRYLKYGYTRATDILCNHVRRGRLTRDEALRLEERIGYDFPETSLGKPVAEVLAHFGLTVGQFKAECDKWRV